MENPYINNEEIYDDDGVNQSNGFGYDDFGGRYHDRRNAPEGSNNAGNVVSWVEKLGNFINRQGLKNTFLAVMVLFLCIIVGYYAFNPKAIIERVEVSQSKAHNEMIQKRKNADHIIKNALNDLRNTLNAQRAFVFETHNGGSNMNGIPFLYIDMTYDEPMPGMKRVMDEYKNVSQTRYELMDIVYDATFWCGSIADIEEIDKELYYRLMKEDVSYLAIMMIYGEYNPIGAVGVSYGSNCISIPNTQTIKRELYKYTGEIVKALSAE